MINMRSTLPHVMHLYKNNQAAQSLNKYHKETLQQKNVS